MKQYSYLVFYKKNYPDVVGLFPINTHVTNLP